jgi:hypothetical protein
MATRASKEGETLSGDSPSRSFSEKEKIEGAIPGGNELNEDDFPHGIKLVLLTVALCLSVFLVALVCFIATLPKNN